MPYMKAKHYKGYTSVLVQLKGKRFGRQLGIIRESGRFYPWALPREYQCLKHFFTYKYQREYLSDIEVMLLYPEVINME